MVEGTNGMAWMDIVAIVGLVVMVIGGIVGVPMWITDKQSKMKSEMYSAMSKNKDDCTATKERVSVLEVKVEAIDEKVGEITEEVRDVKATLNQMQLDNQKNHIDILTAINSQGKEK